jgi:hypothetical protein
LQGIGRCRSNTHPGALLGVFSSDLQDRGPSAILGSNPSRIMQTINKSYTAYIDRRYKRSGQCE